MDSDGASRETLRRSDAVQVQGEFHAEEDC
jgi:hypothetical protein